MNRTLRPSMFVALLLVAVFSVASAAPRKASATKAYSGNVTTDSTCVGGASLSGTYGMLVSGSGKYLAGALNFDGNCNLSGSNISGGSGGQYTTTSVTGTYTQNSDGTYNVTMNFAGQSTADTYLIGVSESGLKARGLESDGTVEAVIDLESQITTLPSGYSTASLTGTYAVPCLNSSAAHLNYVTFDGSGNLSGRDIFDVGSSQGDNPYTGTYSVNSDGTFSGTLLGSYSGYTFNGVIDNGLTEIEYIYNAAGTGPALSCFGKQTAAAPANLLGYYGIVVDGTLKSSGGGKYLSGSVYFDGGGALTATNLYGVINGTYSNTTATGTYTVNSDNTISIAMNLVGESTPQTYIVGVSEAGNEAAGVETDGSSVATVDMQTQLQLPASTYNAASLNGTYSASCSGFGVDLNYVTFDGNGNLTGIDGYYNGAYGDSPYTGTYTVNTDGTFTGGFAGDYSVFTMTGVIDNVNAEIEYTYNEAGFGGIVGCIGESTYGPVGGNPVAATPTFSPTPGAFGGAQSVTLSDTTPGAVIYYTTNGAAPTILSPVYSVPIPVSATTTIRAIAVQNGFNNSAIAAGTYFITTGLQTAATPAFSPAPGNYSSPQSVVLSDTTVGATIYYTTDGTTPTTSSPVYASPIQVSVTTTIEAIAAANGYANSAVAAGTYTITLPTTATPTFSPAPGSYPSPQSVTLSDATTGAIIYYTTNGTTPTTSSTVYTSPIQVSATTTIEAMAVANGYNNSAVAIGTYTITSSTGKVVNLASYYNVFGIATMGTAPTHGGFDNDSYDFNSSLLGASLTYQSLVFPLAGANVADAVTSQTIALPGGSYGQLFVLGGGVNGNQTNQSIVVTYTDGTSSTFSQNFSDWAHPQSYSGEATVIANASRIGPNGQTATPAVYVFGYTFNLNTGKAVASVKLPSNRNVVFLAMGLGNPIPTAATPGFSPAPGTYTSAQSDQLSDTTNGAVIHYTTDGTTPAAGSSVYSAPITLHATTTIKAIAVAAGYNNSAVALGVYTLNGTPIAPYIQVNGGSWQQSASATVPIGSAVNLGPQPLTGSWSWTGPNGYTSTSRQINNIPLSIGGNTYIATYTNSSGVQSTQTFTITATATWTKISTTDINSIACASDGTLIVATSAQQAVWEYISGKWNQLPGQMRRVAIVSQNNVWGIGLDGNVYRLSGTKWIRVGTNANYIAAGSDGTVLITSARDNSIWKYVSDNNWISVPGATATVIAVVRNNNYFIVGSGNNVYQYNGSSWTTVGSKAAYVRAASDGTVLMTNSSGQIWQYVSPNNWTQVPGTMQIAAPVKLNSYFGLGTDNDPYSYGSH